MLRSPFAPLTLALAALVGGVVKWVVQGSSNVYSSLHQRLYVPDVDFGWRESSQHPVWLGLDALAALTGVVVAAAVAALWIKRREIANKARATILRTMAWVAAAGSCVVPIGAFYSGAAPPGARIALPFGATAAAPTEGIEGALALPPGRYHVVAHRGTAVTARINAGGDEFDARFQGDPQGEWTATPSDFTQPMTATASVAAASVDTGVDLRSEHARGEYLFVNEHPRIEFSLRRLVAARQDGPALVAFRALGQLQLVGKTTDVEVTGTIEALDDAKRARFQLAAPAAVVQATFVLPIADSGLVAGDYDAKEIPVKVSLVLVHQH